MLGKQRHFYGFFTGFYPPLFSTTFKRKRVSPPPCIIIFLLVLGHIWHLQDVGKTETFLRVFYGFLPPLFWTFYFDKIINVMFFIVNVTIPSGNEIYPPSLYNNISVSFRAYLALAGCWENRDIFTGFLRVFTPPFFRPPPAETRYTPLPV